MTIVDYSLVVINVIIHPVLKFKILNLNIQLVSFIDSTIRTVTVHQYLLEITAKCLQKKQYFCFVSIFLCGDSTIICSLIVVKFLHQNFMRYMLSLDISFLVCNKGLRSRDLTRSPSYGHFMFSFISFTNLILSFILIFISFTFL